MLSGSRYCLRLPPQSRRFAQADSSICGPLLFLYPRWFQAIDSQNQETRLSSTTRSGTQLAPDEPISEVKRQRNATEEASQDQDGYSISPQEPDTLVRRYEVLKKWRRVGYDHHVDNEIHARLLKKARMKRRHSVEHLPVEVILGLLNEKWFVERERSDDQLFLSLEAVYHLTGSIGSNNWIHPALQGCHIEISKPHVHKRGASRVSLTGSIRSRELAREALLAAEVEARQRQQIRLDDRSRIYRHVLSSLKAHFQWKTYRRADAVERPEQWTVRTFAAYVETLISMRIPRSVRRDLHSGGEPHNKIVARLLEDLFTNPTSSHAISTRALNAALRFTGRHTEISSTSFVLYERAKKLGLRLEAETFNTVIREALRWGSFKNFQEILVEMRNAGFAPDGVTYMALFNVVSKPKDQEVVIEAMRRNTLLTPAIKRAICSHLLQNAINVDSKSNRHLDTIVAFMDRLELGNWLNASTCSRMLYICMKSEAWNLIPQIIQLAQERNVELTARNLTQMIKITRHRGSVRESINVLTSHLAKTTGRDMAFVTPLIFMTAWRNRFYNICRVLWHYAASHGYISHPMLGVVSLSVMRNNDKSDDSLLHRWRISAGKIIVGTDLEIPDFATRFPLLFKAAKSTNPTDCLTMWVPGDGTREEQLTLAYIVIERDLDAWKRYVPMRSAQLFKLLEAAYAKDQEWKSSKLQVESSTKWMVDNAIQVPLAPLRTEKPAWSKLPEQEAVEYVSETANAELDDDVAVLEDGDSSPAQRAMSAIDV